MLAGVHLLTKKLSVFISVMIETARETEGSVVVTETEGETETASEETRGDPVVVTGGGPEVGIDDDAPAVGTEATAVRTEITAIPKIQRDAIETGELRR